MAFGGGLVSTLADCLPFAPGALDSSLDGSLVTAVRFPSGYSAVASFDIVAFDGGAVRFDGGFADVSFRAVPLDPQTIYLTDRFGGVGVWSAPDTQLFGSPVLGSTVRPGGSFLAAVVSDGGDTLLVTDEGRTTLPFGAPWSTPVFSPGGRYAIFSGLPTLFDLQAGAEYPLVIDPLLAMFSNAGDGVLILGADGTLAQVHFVDLPPPSSQPVGSPLEGTAVSAAALTPNGSGVVYAGTDPIGRTGVFLIAPLW
jgi:hypothetical protein